MAYHGRLPQSRIFDFKMLGEDGVRGKAGATVEGRIDDNRYDESMRKYSSNKGLAKAARVFAMAQYRVWNDWAWEEFGSHNERISPMAAIATGDLDGSIKEIERVAALASRVSHCPANRYGVHMTSITTITTCQSSTRCGR